ncbi:MAG: PaaI family thioesterase [Candidatus Lokiarchaeota archaeon]|nr:PaaI family thioesterase [Candidatus Lokiarchaeota archaeon]
MQKENEITERSKKMIDSFNAIIGMELSKFTISPPFTQWLNGKILNASYRKLEVEFKIRSEMANPTGLLHGGVQSAMLDDVIGMTTATLGLGGFLITIDFHVDFLGKAKVGEKVIVESEITRDGKRIAHAEATIRNSEGVLIATASSNLLKTQYKPDYVKKVDSNQL